jgi:hypothetical protein
MLTIPWFYIPPVTQDVNCLCSAQVIRLREQAGRAIIMRDLRNQVDMGPIRLR